VFQHLEPNCENTERTCTEGDSDDTEDNGISHESLCCTQESRGETPGSEDTRTDPPDGQLDPEVDGNKEKALGKEVLLLMQALNTLSTPEEKLAALCKKYADLLEESRSVQKQMKVLQKKQAQIMKEKVHLQSEHSKAILARSKLESLCRELQRHNKTLKDENTQRAREYEERRKEATAHFQLTLSEIQTQMEQHNVRNASLRQENIELAEKLKKFIEEYELREDKLSSLYQSVELVAIFMSPKLLETTLMIYRGDESRGQDEVFLLNEATESRCKCEVMRHQETKLKQQLSLYMDKFEEFQTTLAKSNEVFTTFRQEMEKMTKKIKKLEKETTVWRTKWENNNKALLEMAEEKTVRDKEYKGLQLKLDRLEKLCRALQTERNELNQKVEVLQGQLLQRDGILPPSSRALWPCSTADCTEEVVAVVSANRESGIQPAPETAVTKGKATEGLAASVTGINSVD
uniref:Taxilin gamma n=1 Tax=Latimeria chalumnae TaxID=7897 RepID=H3A201_LATCH